jgi:hypothetical protein
MPEGGQSVSGFQWQQDVSWRSHRQAVNPEADDLSYPQVSEPTTAEPAMFIKVFDAAARHPLRNGSAQAEIDAAGQWVWTKWNPRPDEIGVPYVAPTVSQGYTLSIVPRPDIVPRTIADFEYLTGETYTKGLQEYMMADPALENAQPPGHTWPYKQGLWYPPVQPSDVYTETKDGVTRPHYHPFDPANPFPLANVLFYWHVPYFYYGRTRKTTGPDGRVSYPAERHYQLLKSPVTIRGTRHLVEGETFRTFVKETHADYTVKSLMLES